MMFVIKFSLLFFLHSVLVECDESEVYHVRLLSPLGDKNILKKSYNIAGTHTFDLFVDPNSNEEPVQRADIAIGKSVVIRCKLADEDTHLEPNLLWFYNGDYIALANDSNKQIETSADQISSNLTIKDVGPSDGGSYECSAANRRKIRKSSKIRFEVIYIFNITELENSEESWCGPKYDNFCKNRGICLYHRTTKILSCKCQPNYFGSYCQNEYISKDVHLKGYSCQQSKP
uniref:Uncharacterized protein n=1 Tax=Romanomermis culicivorax TaxID=13658 RepID=A0A915HPZ4_ROMCU